MPVPEHFTQVQLLPETIVEGKRLGLHLEKDTRSKTYPIRQWITDRGGSYQIDPTKLTSKRWKRNIPVLDQGNLGSCTGNATVGMLACSPLYDKDEARFKHLIENENLAIRLYERATRLDGLADAPYPPNDRGSTTLGALKAAQAMGFIDQYRWGFGLVDALNALALAGAGITGVPWLEKFDEPNNDGTLSIGGKVRGGHELVLDEIIVEKRWVGGTQSWGPDWDQQGRFYWTWDTYAELLHMQGDFGMGVWR